MSKHTTTIMEIIQGELQRQGLNEFINNGKLTFDNQEFQFMQKILKFDDDVKKIVDNIIFKGFSFSDERIDRYFKQSFTTRFLDREIGRQTVEAFASLVLYETIIREDYIHTVFGSEVYKYLENHVDYKGDEIGNTKEDETQNQINEETQNQNSAENQNETQNQNSEENQNETQNQNNTSTTDTNTQNVSSDRELTSSLPQSEINLDVDNDILLYGDSNTISKNKTTNDSNEKTTGKQDSTGKTTTTGRQDTTGETITTGTQDSITNGKQDSTRNSNQDSTSNQTSLTKTYLLENLDKIYSMRERLFNDYDKKCFLHIW